MRWQAEALTIIKGWEEGSWADKPVGSLQLYSHYLNGLEKLP